MDKDYENFVARMGSFEDTFEMGEDTEELKHFGVLGMRWGHSKTGYKSTGVRSALARRSNDKTDASFKEWGKKAERKTTAIDAGKKRNEARVLLDQNPSNKVLKKEYHAANKEYKKALSKATTYHKGVVKQEVGKDNARKYLTEAKRVKKQIDSGNGDPTLQKTYQKLMNKYDVERASARRAPEVAAKRSKKKAAMKRSMTMAVKATATTAAVGVGVTYANKKLAEQGKQPINTEKILKGVKTAKDILGYI